MKDHKILPASTTNIEMVRTLGILNNVPELFDNAKLNDIKILNYTFDKEWHSNNIDHVVHNFNELYKLANRSGDLGVENNFLNNKIQISTPIEQLFREV